MRAHPIRRGIVAALIAASSLAAATAGRAAPTPGLREDFAGSSLGGFTSLAVLSNPGSGGLGGASDGYLEIARPFTGNLGAYSPAPAYAGDWIAGGVTQLRLWLRDTGAAQALEIHVAIGNQGNLWQTTPGFMPTTGEWSEFVVDATTAGPWTQIIGPGTLENALRNADRLLIRHDLSPFFQTPDPIAGEFGVDHILLTDGVVGVGDRPVAARAVEMAAPYPNPSRGPVALSVAAPDAEPLRLEVIDVAGRLVRRAALGAGSGPRIWMWDGRDERGERVPAGCYRARVIGPGGGTSRPLVRID